MPGPDVLPEQAQPLEGLTDVRVKDGVEVNGVQPETLHALTVAAELWRERGDELVVTSLLEGVHKPKSGLPSLHYQGRAADFRTRHLTPEELKFRAEALLERLGPGFDVRVESTHLHVEFDGQTHSQVAYDVT